MSAPQLYRPSCGTEGADFMLYWCGRCERDRGTREDPVFGEGCPIAAATMAHQIDDPKYPREWREDGPEGPRCTAFELAHDVALGPVDEPNQLWLRSAP